ncbi:MAG: hypothetical protein EXS16_00595 [Gemmataceae bacterium]|nr:hypothetical protein [Gemmataceae bacterium]
MKTLTICFLGGLAATLTMPTAHAQFFPGYRPNFPVMPQPGFGNPFFPIGSPGFNKLNGQADVMRAFGDVTNSYEQARIAREKANQAKIETKRQAFDQMLYEKANTPTYLEQLAKDKSDYLTRIMNFPQKAEIYDGRSLNTMLPLLQNLSESGSQGPPIALPKFAVSALNLSVGGQPSVGMLANKAPLRWPSGLRGTYQKNLDKLIPAAVESVIDGALSIKLLKDIRGEMKSLREDTRAKLQRDEIDSSSYFRAIEFYNDLEPSINALDRPDARNQLSGVYESKARNVPELVEFLWDNGLGFAPASPGNQNAYQVTHDAFVRFARTAQSSAGFASINAPIAPVGKKK